MKFLLIYPSCDGCVYSLTKSEAKYKEMNNTKEKEIVVLKDEVAKLHNRYVQYVYQSPHVTLPGTIPIVISLIREIELHVF